MGGALHVKEARQVTGGKHQGKKSIKRKGGGKPLANEPQSIIGVSQFNGAHRRGGHNGR